MVGVICVEESELSYCFSKPGRKAKACPKQAENSDVIKGLSLNSAKRRE